MPAVSDKKAEGRQTDKERNKTDFWSDFNTGDFYIIYILKRTTTQSYTQL